uniref:Uncharacterized protein n=1 Tax=Anguilla anguilla TaxID=7936 RepID=A0A0E9QBG1_ANGAN
MHTGCRKKKKLKKQLELIFQCCKTQSQSPASSQQNQKPQELQEMVPLSPPE